ncbi:MAG: GNAT family protein [Rikenellaceae bacterium]
MGVVESSQWVNLRGEKVVLRSVEPEDVDVMYAMENDQRNWRVSGTTVPFSSYVLGRFVESQQQDPLASGQLRLMIENHGGEVVGIIDLFEIDNYNHRAGVGILIDERYRRGGFGTDALAVLERYAREVLQIHQIWCGIGADNVSSLKLFLGLDYKKVGCKRDWIWSADGYRDEVMMQHILE